MADHARSDDAAVQQQLDRLDALSPGRDILGLERVRALLDRLGNPETKLPPVFHVAGTNGKGSTCAFLRAALEAAGHKVHVYTSPHLVRFNERIRLAGRLIEDARLTDYLGRVLDIADDIGPSFFEVTTAAAFLAFSDVSADACVIEVGLGGRLDATNVLAAPAVTGIAQLGMDHQAFLGDKPEQIAAEKAGIAKAGVPLITQRYPPSMAERVARSWMDADAYALAIYAMCSRLAAGGTIGPESSTNKIFWSELDLALHQTALDILGPRAELIDADPERWLDGYVFALAGPIYAGSNEIQRNIIAERMLGLPRN